MKLKGFDQLVADVGRFEQALATPESFYQAKAPDYWRQARRVAADVLRLLRPPEHDVAEWSRKVDRITDRIITEMLAGGSGVVFGFAPEDAIANGTLGPAGSRTASRAMSYADIKEWIRAGIAGDPWGKRITAIDDKVMREKGIDGVATVVMKAYYSSRPDAGYARLRRAIQRYFLGGRGDAGSALLDVVIKAWGEHFAVVIPRDLADHAGDLCRKF